MPFSIVWGAVILEVAEEMGLKTRTEVISDRAYMEDLSLAPRKLEGAVIHNEDLVLERCVRMIKEGRVTTLSGKDISIKAESLCVHGDSPQSLVFLKKIHEVFTRENIQIKSMY